MLSVIQTISEEFLVVCLGFWIVSLFNVRVHTTSLVKILNIHVTCNFDGVFFFQIKNTTCISWNTIKRWRNTYQFQGLNCIIFLKLRKVYHKYHYAFNCLYFFTWMVIMRWSFRHSIVILQRRKLFKALIDFFHSRTHLTFFFNRYFI